MNWQSREDERVARALEGAPHGRADRAVVALAERIRDVPAAIGLDAAPDFRAALRARVLAEGAALLPRPRTPADGLDERPTADAPSADGHATAPDPAAGRPTAADNQSIAADDRSRSADGQPVTVDSRTGAADGQPVTVDSRSGGARAGAARPGGGRHGRSGRAATRPPAGRRHRRRKAVTATALVIATLSVTTVAASGDALPGDPLYGLKRTVQGVEIIVARSDVDRGRRHLELARTRVRELDTVGPSAAPGPLLSTLDDMDTETRAGIGLLSAAAVQGGDETRLSQLAAWTAQQRALLIAAAARLPEGARSRAADSLALLTAVAARLEELRCDCTPARTPADLGPQPCTAGCATVAPSATAPVQTRTRPPAGSSAPGPTATMPDWPAERAATSPPGRAPAPPGSGSAPTGGPSWPAPAPPRTPAAPGSSAPEPPAPTAGPTAGPSDPAPMPAVVRGVVDVLDGLLGLTS